MQILATLIDDQDPFVPSLIQGHEELGPVLSVVRRYKPDLVVLLKLPRLERQTEQLVQEMKRRFPDLQQEVHALKAQCERDLHGLSEALQEFIAHCCSRHPQARLCVAPYPGGPRAHAAWLRLHHQAGGTFELLDGADTSIRPQQRPYSTKLPAMALGGLSEPVAPVLEDVLKEIGITVGDALTRRLVDNLHTLAERDVPLLLTGPSGTGKATFAFLAHRLSDRHNEPFRVINCTGLSSSNLEGALFGTTADGGEMKPGKLEQVEGGTLLLRNSSALSASLLRRLLQIAHNDPDRDGAEVPFRGRLILTSTQEPKDLFDDSGLQDFFFKTLNGGHVAVPPLSERSGDIIPLVLHFVERTNTYARQPRRISREALRYAEAADWPGNVTQLRQTVERAALLATDQTIGTVDFEGEAQIVAPRPAAPTLPDFAPDFSLEGFLSDMRKRIIFKALEQSGGNQSMAARLLKLSPQAVHQFLKHHRKK